MGINANDVGRKRADEIPKNIANNTNIQVCIGKTSRKSVNMTVLITNIEILVISNFFGLTLSNKTPPKGTNINLGKAVIVNNTPRIAVESVKSKVIQDKDKK
ncbi:hypothetical protein MACH08_10120 [Oceanobacillus kimchii]|uniref:Uncharacterized protein n=1 Tax=Oceanobacillus kimchii TaxID=746691 RepID=A0ABQ5TEG5_9BACI|nr:hypothetical protein MACH08_10120 [Oceanobacillus kimchii]